VWIRSHSSCRRLATSPDSVFDPRHLVDTRRSRLLQSEEARPQDIDVDVMQERRQLVLSPMLNCFASGTTKYQADQNVTRSLP
jgi:hypothetical protein